MATWNELVVCFLLVSLTCAIEISDFNSENSVNDINKTFPPDAEEGELAAEHIPSNPPKKKDLNPDQPHRLKRTPDFLTDMGQPKRMEDEFAAFHKEITKEENNFQKAKLLYTKFKKRSVNKKNSFENKMQKYRPQNFNSVTK